MQKVKFANFKALAVVLQAFLTLASSASLNWEESFTPDQLSVVKEEEGSDHLGDIQSLNPGLYTECNTYMEKYNDSRIKERLQKGGPNEENPHSKYVILLKYHYTGVQTSDFILFLRATAAEAADSGYHFYILYQFTPSATHLVNRQEMLDHLPEELHKYVVFHNFKDTISTYPKLAAHIEEGDSGPGPRGVYLAITHFMHKYPGYLFAWAIEYDIRYTGHIGRFLNSVLHEGIISERQEIGEKPFALQGVASSSLPEEHEEHRLPDLITFGGIGNSTRWLTSFQNMEISNHAEAALMVYGGSRKLFTTIHEYSHLGKVAYMESFVPTVAYMEDLKTVSLNLPSRSGTFHCCTREAAAVYSNYFSSQGKCTHSILLHPIKSRETFWELHKSPLDELLTTDK